MSFTRYVNADKPRTKRAESITQAEVDVHHWLARLAVVLSILQEELPKGALKTHARKTLDEFCDSAACSDSLAAHVKEGR